MRRRRRKTLQRKLPLAPSSRISLPRTVKEEAISALADLIAEVMRQPNRTPREGGGPHRIYSPVRLVLCHDFERIELTEPFGVDRQLSG